MNGRGMLDGRWVGGKLVDGRHTTIGLIEAVYGIVAQSEASAILILLLRRIYWKKALSSSYTVTVYSEATAHCMVVRMGSQVGLTA